MQSVGVRLLGCHDLAGRSDGLQVVGTGSRLFVAHLFSGGFTEVDISDPRSPSFLSFTPAPPGSWSVHLQVQGDLLLVANGPDMWTRPADFDPGRTLFETDDPFAAGVRLFDVSVPGQPREVGFADIGGFGVHRVFYDGGRYALVSAFPDGFAEGILVVLDVSDPARPYETDRWWLPGLGAGERPSWPADHRVSLHHATGFEGRAWGAWRDGGLTGQVLDPDGRLGPAATSVWDGPTPGQGCAAHTALRLPGTPLLAVAEEGIESEGEQQGRRVVLFDVADPEAPSRVGALPSPTVVPVPGARFGPHNLYEYRPGAWMDGRTVFVAHQGAGLRIHRLAAGHMFEEVGHFLPDPPTVLLDPRPGRMPVPQTNDVFVSASGIVSVVDANAGLHVLELL
jgi:hypothetical protein